MSFTQAIRSVFSQYATFHGRARRSEFWWFSLFAFLVNTATALVDTTAFGTSLGDTGPLNIAATLALLVPSLAVSWRRLHDTGRHGAWTLIGLVPLVGWIVLLVFTVQDSAPGANRYGPSPKGGFYPGQGYPQGYPQATQQGTQGHGPTYFPQS